MSEGLPTDCPIKDICPLLQQREAIFKLPLSLQLSLITHIVQSIEGDVFNVTKCGVVNDAECAARFENLNEILKHIRTYNSIT